MHPSQNRFTGLRPFVLATGLAIAFLALTAQPLAAQDSSPDVVRGRVVDDSSHTLAAATISVTRGPDRLTRQTITDSAGNFRVRFDHGTGDYLVYVSAAGFNSARRRVQSQNGEHDLVANFTLPRAVVTPKEYNKFFTKLREIGLVGFRSQLDVAIAKAGRITEAA